MPLLNLETRQIPVPSKQQFCESAVNVPLISCESRGPRFAREGPKDKGSDAPSLGKRTAQARSIFTASINTTFTLLSRKVKDCLL